ncbi:Endonuclease/exonuclease/phosphatase superfamily [Sesbania bispinosa]|nr:Endonuclease/exonuclease/phosphatase superfamily [Sesbania bispinosa]
MDKQQFMSLIYSNNSASGIQGFTYSSNLDRPPDVAKVKGQESVQDDKNETQIELFKMPEGGAGAKTFPGLIRDLARLYHLQFVALLEPRISGSKADNAIKRMRFSGGVRAEAQGFSGGIWVMWKSEVLTVKNRYDLWEELVNFGAELIEPWCVMGVFNTILYEFEKVGGVGVNRRAMKVFANCLENCGLQEFQSTGPFLTWQRGTVKERLDRVVCSSSWRMTFQQASVINLALPTSDHRGIWLKVDSLHDQQRIQKPFKFLACWLSHPEFQDQVFNPFGG